MLAAERARDARRAAVPDLESFLQGLGMRARVELLRPDDVPRVAQLVNRCNQFNVTGARVTESSLHAVARDPATVACVLRLRDDIGDHGLVSAVIAREGVDGGCDIDTWVMSCRVLARGVEAHLLRRLMAACRARGLRRLRGRFIDTGRNEAVRTLFERLGFEPHGDAWSIAVDDEVRVPDSVWIKEETAP